MKTCYAVGKYLGYDEVDRESLVFFKTETQAHDYYYKVLFEDPRNVDKLAVFYIEDNMITRAYGLRPVNFDLKCGPVGPINEEQFI